MANCNAGAFHVETSETRGPVLIVGRNAIIAGRTNDVSDNKTLSKGICFCHLDIFVGLWFIMPDSPRCPTPRQPPFAVVGYGSRTNKPGFCR
jgi:hypothetical protein